MRASWQPLGANTSAGLRGTRFEFLHERIWSAFNSRFSKFLEFNGVFAASALCVMLCGCCCVADFAVVIDVIVFGSIEARAGCAPRLCAAGSHLPLNCLLCAAVCFEIYDLNDDGKLDLHDVFNGFRHFVLDRKFPGCAFESWPALFGELGSTARTVDFGVICQALLAKQDPAGTLTKDEFVRVCCCCFR